MDKLCKKTYQKIGPFDYNMCKKKTKNFGGFIDNPVYGIYKSKKGTFKG